MRWLDAITSSMDMNLGKVWEMVRNREAWCAAAHRVEKSRTWLSDWTTTVCICRSQPPTLHPSPSLSPLGTINVFSYSLSLFKRNQFESVKFFKKKKRSMAEPQELLECSRLSLHSCQVRSASPSIAVGSAVRPPPLGRCRSSASSVLGERGWGCSQRSGAVLTFLAPNPKF